MGRLTDLTKKLEVTLRADMGDLGYGKNVLP
jgi:hypothetical protein